MVCQDHQIPDIALGYIAHARLAVEYVLPELRKIDLKKVSVYLQIILVVALAQILDIKVLNFILHHFQLIYLSFRPKGKSEVGVDRIEKL